MSAGVNSFLKNIVNAYNKKESKLAEEEKQDSLQSYCRKVSCGEWDV